MEEYRDNNNDGVVDVKYTNTLDANGHVIEQAKDVNNDGVVDKVERYTLDAQGRPEFIYVDNGANNVVDRIEGVTRNANGHIIQRDYYIGDTITTTPNAVRTYEVDANGQVLKEFNDSNADGQVDSIVSYVKDVYGLNVEVQTDTNADGAVDRLTTYTYDTNGNVLSYQGGDTVKHELNELGFPTVSHVFDTSGKTALYDMYKTYNNLNQLVRVVYDYNFNGPEDDKYYENYKYDSVYGYLERTWGTNFQGDVSGPEIYHRDGLGNLLYVQYSSGGTEELTTPIYAMSFGIWNGAGALDHTEDFTTWTPERLNEFQNGLSLLMLSNDSASTTITLDKNVIDKMAASSLTITGDNHDTVILKGLTASDNTSTTSEHNIYTFTADDGSAYELKIENDINVVFS